MASIQPLKYAGKSSLKNHQMLCVTVSGYLEKASLRLEYHHALAIAINSCIHITTSTLQVGTAVDEVQVNPQPRAR
jgi:hypothetical protein